MTRVEKKHERIPIVMMIPLPLPWDHMLTLCNYRKHVHKDFETIFYAAKKKSIQAQITIHHTCMYNTLFLKICSNIPENDYFTQLITDYSTETLTFSDTEHDDHYE